jgi:hypothetical protein
VAAPFDPAAIQTFRFVDRSLDSDGTARLGYALDDRWEFVERVVLPMPRGGVELDDPAIQGLLALLHWVAGVSYFKAAAPAAVACETGAPPPATRALLEALYSEGLGEFAIVAGLPEVPHPAFPSGARVPSSPPPSACARVLVPFGGGKDSVVALEIARRTGLDIALFSVGDATPIRATAAVAGLPRLIAQRQISPRLLELNAAGALNGHVPVTAIVSCIALLTAALHGYDTVALANERSASAPNTTLGGVEINHQFSKSARVERLLSAAVSECAGAPRIFSVLRPASELAIARAFATMPDYHHAFTSCNRVFKLDPQQRATSWCGDCDKCRFVFLILAPFMEPQALAAIFGRDLLDDERQFDGFALLTGTGGHKPFECVGEVQESVAALRLLSGDPRWRTHRVVARLEREVLPRFAPGPEPDDLFALGAEHEIPDPFIGAAHAVLGA